MTAPMSAGLPTAEALFRTHITAMRDYARGLEPALGQDSPIVKRIYSCARSNEEVLDRIAEIKAKADAKPCDCDRCPTCGRKQVA